MAKQITPTPASQFNAGYHAGAENVRRGVLSQAMRLNADYLAGQTYGGRDFAAGTYRESAQAAWIEYQASKTTTQKKAA